MEQHPVPQPITSYEFRLVGDMTLRQFGKLASGVILALIVYGINPAPGILKWGLIMIFVALGAGMAFLPFQGRPLDVWIVSFFKRIYSPTQYVWRMGGKLDIKPSYEQGIDTNNQQSASNNQPVVSDWLPVTENQTESTTNNKQPASTARLDSVDPRRTKPALHGERGEQTTNSIISDSQISPITLTTPTITTNEPKTLWHEGKPIQPTSSEPPAPETKEATDILYRSPFPTNTTPTREEILTVNQISPTVKAPKLSSDQIKTTIYSANSQNPSSTDNQSPITNNRMSVPPVFNPSLVIPTLPNIPNILGGFVKDVEGKLVEGAIIEVRDVYLNPVRAFKTNKLGQFQIATPLPDGTYEIETEKDGLSFDIIKIELKGEILPPFEIIAKQNLDH